MCACVHTLRGGQLWGVGSLLPLCGPHSVWRVPLPAEPSYQPTFINVTRRFPLNSHGIWVCWNITSTWEAKTKSIMSSRPISGVVFVLPRPVVAFK